MTNSVYPGYRIHKNTGVFLANASLYPPQLTLVCQKQYPNPIFMKTFSLTVGGTGGYRNTLGIDMHPDVKKRPNPALSLIPL